MFNLFIQIKFKSKTFNKKKLLTKEMKLKKKWKKNRIYKVKVMKIISSSRMFKQLMMKMNLIIFDNKKLKYI